MILTADSDGSIVEVSMVRPVGDGRVVECAGVVQTAVLGQGVYLAELGAGLVLHSSLQLLFRAGQLHKYSLATGDSYRRVQVNNETVADGALRGESEQQAGKPFHRCPADYIQHRPLPQFNKGRRAETEHRHQHIYN